MSKSNSESMVLATRVHCSDENSCSSYVAVLEIDRDYARFLLDASAVVRGLREEMDTLAGITLRDWSVLYHVAFETIDIDFDDIESGWKDTEFTFKGTVLQTEVDECRIDHMSISYRACLKNSGIVLSTPEISLAVLNDFIHGVCGSRITEKGDTVWCEVCGETPATHFEGMAVLCPDCKERRAAAEHITVSSKQELLERIRDCPYLAIPKWIREQPDLATVFADIEDQHRIWFLSKGYCQFEAGCPWQTLRGVWIGYVLEKQPQYIDLVDIGRVQGASLACLLGEHPDIADVPGVCLDSISVPDLVALAVRRKRFLELVPMEDVSKEALEWLYETYPELVPCGEVPSRKSEENK